ncbi:hypothetical protein N780_15360 [Pontibacillus chungwhensis BH030062]|uniref:DUF5067 domain-containing protein n=1 Tax=Pontibacillus chungwhensis BH030062 TaxID=1385513 RepID=A0A0A2UUL2_9BACI|nr:hypothetical protein [Pontibacillus chungwhensis]KGP91982.1 hypothetical protein N780_15360 [Pontibacillus chungwhensis BH030062]
MKKYIWIVASLIILSSVMFSYISYAQGETIKFTKESKIQLHPRESAESGLALSLDAVLSNNSSQHSQPYYVVFEITNKQLQKKVKTNKFRPGNLDKTQVLKPHSTLTPSYTVPLEEDIDLDTLRKIIGDHAVKVNVFNGDHKIIKSNFITNFELDIRPENI